MATKRFKAHKLVRDNIHELFKAWDMTSHERVLAPEEFNAALFSKLNEEVSEIAQARTQEEFNEEIADVLELLHALACAQNIAWSDIEAARLAKREKKGGYEKRLFMDYIEMDESNPRFTDFKNMPEKFPEIV